ncbi:hypothetical protein EXIGLDRAFT_776687 [Exidia glandulosa HHB12029]|uniref:Mediator of RNA polymerase II transcription subunit 11 n=1 Tax=Exidia glandulosa HHB12029 TaxID=1314781 RepID=A0A165DDS0_EXIGL|nr:hypothetical protein EXIGLDRAFT_776687 [Exidia glandulosa HHB12029]
MPEHNDINPIFLSTDTARKIYELGEDITKLLQSASTCVALLTIPELDPPEQEAELKPSGSPSSEASTPRDSAGLPSRPRLPVGEERSEQFVMEATQYYETLDTIHLNLRTAMAHLRRERVAPAAITAPPPGFVPTAFGVGPEAGLNARGLQETRLERDAWRGVVDALERLKVQQTAATPDSVAS